MAHQHKRGHVGGGHVPLDMTMLDAEILDQDGVDGPEDLDALVEEDGLEVPSDEISEQDGALSNTVRLLVKLTRPLLPQALRMPERSCWR